MADLNCIVRPGNGLTSDQLKLLGERLSLWRRSEAAAGRRHKIETSALQDLAAGELPQPMALLIAQHRGAKLAEVRRAFADRPNAHMLNARLIMITIKAAEPEIEPAFDALLAAVGPSAAGVHRL